MKKFFLFPAALLLISLFSHAKILRVGYTGPQVAGVDYADGQSAHNAAIVGDTLQFYPGSYSINTYNKKLILLGNGYLLSGTGSNAGLNLITGSTDIEIVPAASSTTSNGTVLSGFSSAYVDLRDNQTLTNITITRCNSALFAFGSNKTGIVLTDCKITQCYAANLDPTNGVGNTNLILNNFRVENCRFNGATLQPLHPSSTILISNCYGGTLNYGNNNVTVQNCIFSGGGGNGVGVSNTIFNNNIFSWTPAIAGANNQFNVNVENAGANVLVGFPTQGTYSADARYQLTATSPAKNAGVGGVDIGIFGGLNPYHLSGIPAIPAFYLLDAATPNATNNPYTITYSVRSNN